MRQFRRSLSTGLRTALFGGLLVGAVILTACGSGTSATGSAAAASDSSTTVPSQAVSSQAVSSQAASSQAASSQAVSSVPVSSVLPAPTDTAPGTTASMSTASSSTASSSTRSTPTAALSSTVAPAATTTVVHRYEPWAGGQVSAGIKVVDRSTGNCLSAIASRRSDAARCFFGNSVADPCFIGPTDATMAICPTHGPDEVTVVTLDTRAVPTGSNTSGDAWLARTTSGVFCQSFTGAGSVTDGVQNWGCTGGELSMARRQSATTWTGMFTPTNSKKSTKVSISEVWT